LEVLGAFDSLLLESFGLLELAIHDQVNFVALVAFAVDSLASVELRLLPEENQFVESRLSPVVELRATLEEGDQLLSMHFLDLADAVRVVFGRQHADVAVFLAPDGRIPGFEVQQSLLSEALARTQLRHFEDVLVGNLPELVDHVDDALFVILA